MKLSELLNTAEMEMQRLRDVDVTGLTANSRAVQTGYLFAALPGTRTDGRAFIDDAVARGAVAILAPTETLLSEEHHSRDVQLVTTSNPRRGFARMAARFFGEQPKTVAAITGTNGKTSVAHFVQQIWASLNLKAGYMGTLGAWAPDMHIEGSLTTPDPEQLHDILAEMAQHGTTHLAMEASSHGLHQYRIDGVHIDIAAFTNLSRDHLDYHGSMDAYRAAKARLFGEVLSAGGTAVLNAGSEDYDAFAAPCLARGIRIIDYGRGAKAIRLSRAEIDGTGQSLDIAVNGAAYSIHLPLPGAFQASNALCALGCVIAAGGDIARSVGALETLAGVPGRLERIGQGSEGGSVYVDYAHSPDALETALAALWPHVAGSGRLIVVFGCGGDRDRGKRRIMGEITRRFADAIYITDDNPRTEDAAAIRAEVLQGCPDATEIGDRRTAIATAIANLKASDVLLVAGKGHETGQIVGTRTIPFSDADAVRTALAREARS